MPSPCPQREVINIYSNRFLTFPDSFHFYEYIPNK